MSVSQAWVEALATAIREHERLPEFPAGLGVDEGYAIQAQVAELVSPTGFAGIKAGVTNAELQARFGIDHGLLGRLYANGAMRDGVELKQVAGRSLECEIGVVVDGTGKPRAVGPAIEVVRVAFARAEDATGGNLLAANVGADGFITGTMAAWRDDWSEADWSQVVIRLYRDDELILEANALDAQGGPAKGVAWITAEARARELQFADGDLFMTGTCGGLIPGEPGAYRADYGVLGSLEFTIR